MVDRFLGWRCISCLGRMDTRAVTDILRDWFVDYGVPQFIRSNGGPQFRSEFQDFCRDMHITHQLSSAYHPASNDHAEFAVKSMKMLLQKPKNNWRYFRQSLPKWRNVPRIDGLSPAQWLFGRRLRTPQIPSHPASYNRVSNGDYLAALLKRDGIEGKSQDSFNARSSVLTPLSPNTDVLVQDPHSKKWNQSATIIRFRENGQSYIISMKSQTTIRNRRQIRPYRDSLSNFSDHNRPLTPNVSDGLDSNDHPEQQEREIVPVSLRRGAPSRPKTVRFNYPH
ncbi:uncharacterized protein K02A2.6-like [Tigriopus californicus]|uniref:uncharacterized protein K02A2.6-like n=1 Tax=Tigriopus californicus TaxID=6832 RepID=UPI0027DA35E9|nr:uncharacterized protein K02A2.6-like [Tigriopus californicus]